MKLGLLFAALVLCGSRVVVAGPDSASCSVIELSATKADKPSIDAELKPLEKTLKDPPFSAWNSFKLLQKASLDLPLSKPHALPLKNGGKASIMLRANVNSRVPLEILIDNAAGSRTVNAKPDLVPERWFGVADTDKNKDGHLVALSWCKRTALRRPRPVVVYEPSWRGRPSSDDDAGCCRSPSRRRSPRSSRSRWS